MDESWPLNFWQIKQSNNKSCKQKLVNESIWTVQDIFVLPSSMLTLNSERIKGKLRRSSERLSKYYGCREAGEILSGRVRREERERSRRFVKCRFEVGDYRFDCSYWSTMLVSIEWWCCRWIKKRKVTPALVTMDDMASFPPAARRNHKPCS